MLSATNVRLGHATNSSSSHSMLLLDGPYESQPGDGGAHMDHEFGWDSFTLGDSNSRMAYLAQAVKDALRYKLKDYQVAAVLQAIFPAFPAEDVMSGYIDHQSAFSLGGADTEVFPLIVAEAAEFFRDKRLQIYGGNDNDDSGDRGDFTVRQGGIRIRRDGDAYVVFNMHSGGKVRLAPAGQKFLKASRPELVDLKITDKCVYGCSFCYQGSTKDGKEPNIWEISEIIEAIGMKGLGAFEVAIGGGEPTSHEYFAEIIGACINQGLVPNFTTFGVDWLLDKNKLEAARKCGGIGVSVHGAKDMRKVNQIRERLYENGSSRVSVVPQHVFGTLPMKETADLIRAASQNGRHLLLLGYKTSGFGKSMEQIDQRGILNEIHYLLKRQNTYGDPPLILSVDTSFINQHQWFMDEIGAKELCYHRVEGSFSMYVDAVERLYGLSSYAEKETMTPIPMNKFNNRVGDADDLAHAFLKSFKQYDSEPA